MLFWCSWPCSVSAAPSSLTGAVKMDPKRAVGAQAIIQPRIAPERWLVQTVSWQARATGIGTPEVAIYESPNINPETRPAPRTVPNVLTTDPPLGSMSWHSFAIDQ